MLPMGSIFFPLIVALFECAFLSVEKDSMPFKSWLINTDANMLRVCVYLLYPLFSLEKKGILILLYPLFSLEKKGILILCQSRSVVRPCVRPSVTFLVNVSPPKPLEVATSNFVVG